VAYDLLTGALFVPIVGALFWRRATAAGALASMVAGSVVVVIFMVLDGLFANTPIIWGMLASLVVFVGVSLFTPKPSEERMRTWERRLTGGETTQVSREAWSNTRIDKPFVGGEQVGSASRDTFEETRLDIEGEDISEEALARYIVEDMRLLMVEEVRILNKESIGERHKRPDPSWAPTSDHLFENKSLISENFSSTKVVNKGKRRGRAGASKLRPLLPRSNAE
jgi:hypothetical protein